MDYRNPKPVVVMIVDTPKGILLVKRALADGYGSFALPGGFQEEGETWQQAGAREVLEETGINIDPGAIEIFDVETVGEGLTINLIYGWIVVKGISINDQFTSKETLEIGFTDEPIELAFPSHTEKLSNYIDG